MLSLSNFKPTWDTFNKPPLTKYSGDLQGKILHGIIAFISICTQLFFRLLKAIFDYLNGNVSMPVFIYGFKFMYLFMVAKTKVKKIG